MTKNKDWNGNSKTTFVMLGASNHTEKEREKFYDVPSFKGRLKINKLGQVYSCITNKILKTSTLPTGYITLILMLKNPRHSKTLYLHRLLAETFIPNPNNLPQVNHKDGNKQNNNIENLEWCTQRENNIHALKQGLRIPNIEKCLQLNIQKRKLTNEQAKYIKLNIKKTTKELCNDLNLNYKDYNRCIFDIKRNRGYRDVK